MTLEGPNSFSATSSPVSPSQILDGIVKNEKSDPKVKFKDDERISLEGSIKEKVNNISILLRNVDFSDTGKYTCFVKNPKENHAGHNATIFLQVVDKRMHLGPGLGQWSGKDRGVQFSVTGKGHNGPRWCFLSLYTFKSNWSYIWKLEELSVSTSATVYLGDTLSSSEPRFPQL